MLFTISKQENEMKHLFFGSIFITSHISSMQNNKQISVTLPSLNQTSKQDDATLASGKNPIITQRNEQKQKKECATRFDDCNLRASTPYRQLAYEACVNIGHRKPESIVITNNSDDLYAVARVRTIKNTVVQMINFDESVWKHYSMGARRIAMHHEAHHLFSNDCCKSIPKYNSHVTIQNQEREADEKALLKGNCKQCAAEFVAFFLLRHTKDNIIRRALFPFFSIQDLATLGCAEIKLQLINARKLSNKKNIEHPFDIERALSGYLNMQRINALCCYHEQKTVESNEQKINEKVTPIINKQVLPLIYQGPKYKEQIIGEKKEFLKKFLLPLQIKGTQLRK